MNTEDDTFRILKRTPFWTVKEKMQDIYDRYDLNERGNHIDMLLDENHWTYDEYRDETDRIAREMGLIL